MLDSASLPVKIKDPATPPTVRLAGPLTVQVGTELPGVVVGGGTGVLVGPGVGPPGVGVGSAPVQSPAEQTKQHHCHLWHQFPSSHNPQTPPSLPYVPGSGTPHSPGHKLVSQGGLLKGHRHSSSPTVALHGVDDPHAFLE
ncbi:hypothetical protein A3D01_01065 [Candidatus Woesebacteria bacterium RIFCSPHIGHO2_02_FULL_39_13]|uniref:Uncharacterized protein n=1 Tax=Candidatus Woesebacteria bacterium RIFCSPHIGHO2_02_FULL_39_13 TaxID=1802505 RepID=A0A1F7YZN6_9BACT|nr:MAG: hypothetical protein A3D01_01065 [Candidatus Woesebacteria bacterium RIFCSPHIGHO2_02_FULL_39_13]OGM37920.1 MAG: hypothetical protein A3E13_04415 [Candidatus Woesebacteria bacterium RIFCSPHIGHO2_12_FULL_40_20]OGM74362.1 MAG: hypothetical protein A3H19_01915 [Candidatus Woesebacteria bacterium RIFCSPLOWO2_12_FULL_39_9]